MFPAKAQRGTRTGKSGPKQKVSFATPRNIAGPLMCSKNKCRMIHDPAKLELEPRMHIIHIPKAIEAIVGSKGMRQMMG